MPLWLAGGTGGVETTRTIGAFIDMAFAIKSQLQKPHCKHWDVEEWLLLASHPHLILAGLYMKQDIFVKGNKEWYTFLLLKQTCPSGMFPVPEILPFECLLDLETFPS